MTVCPDDIFWTTEHCVTKLGLVVYHRIVGKNVFPIFKQSRLRLHYSNGSYDKKYDSFYCIFWTADSLATRLGPMIHHHKPECCNRTTTFKVKVTAKVQNVSDCPYDIFWTAKHFVSKLGILMHHYVPECHTKRLFAISKVKVTARPHSLIKIWQFLLSSFRAVDPFATKLGLMVHCLKSECLMKKLDCCVQYITRSQ